THRWARHWTPAVILEGFVYDIPVHDDLHIARSRVRPIEDRLADLGAIVVLLTVPSRLVLQRCVCSTRTHRGPGWAEHLERIAATDTARAAYFRAAQDRLRRWVHNGPLPVWEIDTTGQDWNRYADHISQHLIGSARGERTGERCARLPPFEEFCV
ncbi:MAG: hypothetical protein J2P17_01315, partial [Mycobacterium sp.]|nr:hypothetical protein [Mycobacterium sp.]